MASQEDQGARAARETWSRRGEAGGAVSLELSIKWNFYL